MNHQGEFIKRILKEKKITQEHLASEIDVSRGQIVSLLKNIILKEDSIGTVAKILSYLDLTIDDLPQVSEAEKMEYLRGIMQNVNDKSAFPAVEALFSNRNPPHLGKEIPVYKQPISAGAVQIYNDEPEVHPEYNVIIPQFSDCEFGRMVYGNSMHPTYKQGEIVFLKKQSGSYIMFGEVYWVEVDDFTMIKRLQRHDDEAWLIAESDNEEIAPGGKRRFQPMPIRKEDIRKIYLVKGRLSQEQL